MEIPDEHQIPAMLDGTLPVLLRDRGIDPERVDLRRFITVDRASIVGYLTAHPGESETYLSRHGGPRGDHDVARLTREGNVYLTCWMDHGVARSVRQFATLDEAVAEHVLVSHGLG